jgi:hypothetical protein
VPALPDYLDLRVYSDRLGGRLKELGQVGAIEGGGRARLALTDAGIEARRPLAVGADILLHILVRLAEEEDLPATALTGTGGQR